MIVEIEPRIGRSFQHKIGRSRMVRRRTAMKWAIAVRRPANYADVPAALAKANGRFDECAPR